FIGESVWKRYVCATRAIALARPARIGADRRCRGDTTADRPRVWRIRVLLAVLPAAPGRDRSARCRGLSCPIAGPMQRSFARLEGGTTACEKSRDPPLAHPRRPRRP